MSFERQLAFGMRLDIAAGTAVRFEPGEEKEVQLVSFGGAREVFGFNGLINGSTSSELNKQTALEKAASNHFKNK